MIKLLETWQGIRPDSQNHTICSIYVNTMDTHNPAYVHKHASQNRIESLHLAVLYGRSLHSLYLFIVLPVRNHWNTLTHPWDVPRWIFPSPLPKALPMPTSMLLEWMRIFPGPGTTLDYRLPLASCVLTPRTMQRKMLQVLLSSV